LLSIDISLASTKAEEGQDRQNYDDETDEINQSVHEFLLASPHSLKRLSIGKVPDFGKFASFLPGVARLRRR
jgi:hypothetical protein